MYGKKFQWIQWVGAFGLIDSIDLDLDDGCTYEQLATVSNGMLTTQIGLFTEDEFDNKRGVIDLVTSYSFIYIFMLESMPMFIEYAYIVMFTSISYS